MPKEGKSLKLTKIHEAGPWSWLKAHFIWPRTTDMRCYRCMERRSRRREKDMGGKRKRKERKI
jgi:hypothetical protein